MAAAAHSNGVPRVIVARKVTTHNAVLIVVRKVTAHNAVVIVTRSVVARGDDNQSIISTAIGDNPVAFFVG